MKKIAMFPVVAALLLASCDSSRVLTSTVDDVYASPKEEKDKEAKQRALARAEREEEERLANQQRESKKEKEESNSYYKDPEYNSEDYYDYAYSSRINRFHNPMGLGYYDAYYTNMYTYNQNPAFYGTSIYNSWGMMPSQQFSSISFGISNSWGYGGYGMGYNYGMGYSPYCSNYYDPFYYDPWCPYPSYYGGMGYMNGYNNGYWNGYNNAMYQSSSINYYNSLDANSHFKPVNAPRGTNLGGGRRSDNNGRVDGSSGYQQRYVESVSEQRNNSSRFDHSNSGRVMQQNEGTTPARNSSNQQTEKSVPQERNTRNTGRSRNDNKVQREQQVPAEQSPQRRSEPVVAPAGSGNNPGNSSMPRNSGGGGTHRPR